MTAFFIARRYFFSKKKKNFIHILTNLSMLVVALGTMALIIVLSTFNGLEDLTRALHTAHNPELKILASSGKTFTPTPLQEKTLAEHPELRAITPVIEDNALLRYGETQTVIKMKGVAPNFTEQYELEPYLKEGKFRLFDEEQQPMALLGAGVQYQIAAALYGSPTPLVFWYPEQNKKLSVANPSKNFRRRPIYPGGVLALEQQFDENYVLVPLAFARKLTGYDSAVSYLEVRTVGNKSPESLKDDLHEVFPAEDFLIQTADEQQAVILRAFRIERLFAFLAFACIIGVASFNIFFSLAMLVIEKRKDLAILQSLGGSPTFLQRIFLWEGAIIALSGTALGLLLGFLIVFFQQEFELVQLGVETSVVSAYPVGLRLMDFVWTGLAVLLITITAALVPAYNAKRIEIQRWI